MPHYLHSPRRNMGPGKLFDGLFPAVVIVSLLSFGLAQSPSDPTANASSPSPSPSLERVIGQMDAAASSFRTTEATVLWDQYQKVVDEHEAQKGKVYFRRAGNEIQMAADITEPDQKYVLFNGSKVQVYQPKIEQVTAYNTGKNREAFESFLVLGFGGRGHDMLKSFQVKYLGDEKIDAIDAAKLELVPKAANVRNNVTISSCGSTPPAGFPCNSSFSLGLRATIVWPNIPISR